MQNSAKTNANDLSQWFTFDGFIETHPNFNRNQLEWLYRKRKTNMFARAFRKIGKWRYVHAGIFSECLHEEE